MIICKFGGTSVQNVKNIQSIIEDKIQYNDKIVLVFSAFGKTTNNLIDNIDDVYANHNSIMNELFGESLVEVEDLFKEIKLLLNTMNNFNVIPHEIKERILSYGELLSSEILFRYFKKIFDCSISKMNSETIIVKNIENKVDFEETGKRMEVFFQDNNTKLTVASGYICSDVNGDISTLGRGGSDYTASIIGSIMKANSVEIWTDVDGVLTSDPRYIRQTQNIPRLSYEEMMRLAHYGANVIYTPTIAPLAENNIKLVVKNSLNPNFKGTLISNEKSYSTAISTLNNIVLFKIYGAGLIGNKGLSARLFTTLYNYSINIILISQSSSEYSIYFVVSQKDQNKARHAIDKEFIIENDILIEEYYKKSIISIETSNILHILHKTTKILLDNEITPDVYNVNDNNICFVVDTEIVYDIVNLIHDKLFHNKKKNIYLIGTGLVGTSLLNQLADNVNVVGTINSRAMTHSIYGDEDADMSKFIEYILSDTINNKIVVDCTASDVVLPYYELLLSRNIGVVTPNKRGNAQKYSIFAELTSFSHYKYETTVCAGLPIISTIHNLLLSGDKIIKIEGVLSGTLSYIFTEFNNSKKNFIDIVKQAERLGYTEPNPLEDLNGLDVMRKILILARISGYKLELGDVINKHFLNEKCLQSKNKEEFYDALKSIKIIKKSNKQLRHVACLENGNAIVELKYLDVNHSFANLQGSDNMVIITTERYFDRPIIIQGPGAGAEVTSAGVLADILSI